MWSKMMVLISFFNPRGLTSCLLQAEGQETAIRAFPHIQWFGRISAIILMMQTDQDWEFLTQLVRWARICSSLNGESVEVRMGVSGYYTIGKLGGNFDILKCKAVGKSGNLLTNFPPSLEHHRLHLPLYCEQFAYLPGPGYCSVNSSIKECLKK